LLFADLVIFTLEVVISYAVVFEKKKLGRYFIPPNIEFDRCGYLKIEDIFLDRTLSIFLIWLFWRNEIYSFELTAAAFL